MDKSSSKRLPMHKYYEMSQLFALEQVKTWHFQIINRLCSSKEKERNMNEKKRLSTYTGTMSYLPPALFTINF